MMLGKAQLSIYITDHFSANENMINQSFLGYLLLSKPLFQTSEFHLLPRVIPKHLCALAHLGCTLAVALPSNIYIYILTL